MKWKKVVPFYYDKDGMLHINMSSNEADADWLLAGRLAEKAAKGDVEAQKELDRMANSPMYEAVGLIEGQPEPDTDWDDPNMSEEQWNDAMRKERESTLKRKFWFTVHNLRDDETVKVSLYGLPIGVWVLDQDRVIPYYTKGFEDEQRAAENWIKNSSLPASKQIRYNYERSSSYGDWWRLGQTAEEYDSAKEVAEVFLKQMKESWQ